jgi:hypothetical protein
MPDTKIDTVTYTKRGVVLVGKKKQYRDLLEACRTPSSLSQIHFCMTKKMGKAGLIKAVKRMIRAGLLSTSGEYKDSWQPPLYKLTDIGERLISVAPGNKKTVQWIIGGDNGR